MPRSRPENGAGVHGAENCVIDPVAYGAVIRVWRRAWFSAARGRRRRRLEGWMEIYRFLECTAGQYMTPSVMTLTRDCTMSEAEALFAKHDFNAFPVAEDGKLVGIVSKFDFLKAFVFTTGQMMPQYDDLMGRAVVDVMTEGVVHVESSTRLTRVLQLMVNLRIRSFPVLGPDRELLGMISRGDVMRALGEATQGGR
jgi:CBS domain-containing protein